MNALPIGTVRLWILAARKKQRAVRVIKVSHHGHSRARWRPYAQHLWITTIAPIPEGFQVYHRDGDSLNDDISNLVIAREERFRLVLQTKRSQARQVRRRAKGVSRANRRRARIASSQLQRDRYYVVLPVSRAIIWIPCRSEESARHTVTPDRLIEICESNVMPLMNQGTRGYYVGDPVEILTGKEIASGSRNDGETEGFVRLIPDTRRAPRKRGMTADLVESVSAN